MSLKSWKQEFFPVPISEVKKGDALTHALRKWTGLTTRNLKRHGLSNLFNVCIEDSDHNLFGVSTSTCSLCKFYRNHTGCLGCPLVKLSGKQCDLKGEPFYEWSKWGDPQPMIRALKKCIKLEGK